MNHCLAVDLGTTHIKLGVYDASGNQIESLTASAKADLSRGYNVQYPDDFVHTLKEIFARLRFALSDIDVIIFSGQMAGVVGVDEQFNAVTIWSGTIDTRSLQIANPDPEKVFRVSGCMTPFSAQKILMLEQDARATKYIGLPSYVAAKLFGGSINDAFIQESNITWTGLVDLAERQWSDELIELFGIDAALLPRIAKPVDVVGEVSARAASELGFRKGVKIIAGAGDKAASCVGLGIRNAGDVIDESASVPSMMICVNEFRPDLENGSWETLPGLDGDKFYLTHYMPGTGLALEWYIRTFAQKELAEAKDDIDAVYQVLEEKAIGVPAGSEGLLCVSHLAGRTLPYEPHIRGAFVGHGFRHTGAHFYRAFLESFAYEYARVIRNCSALYPEFELSRIKSIGGGADSYLMNQIKSDVLRLEYSILGRNDYTLFGSAAIAFLATGVWRDLDHLDDQPVKQFYIPTEENMEVYQNMTRLFDNWIEQNSDTYKELLRLAERGAYGS